MRFHRKRRKFADQKVPLSKWANCKISADGMMVELIALHLSISLPQFKSQSLLIFGFVFVPLFPISFMHLCSIKCDGNVL